MAVQMTRDLVNEQEILKRMLPATTPHRSIKGWVTRQMICVRFVKKVNSKRKRETRVACITPTTFFLVHEVGEVRRFVKMSQVEAAVLSRTQAGPQLLLKCASPEHDMLLIFADDSRNDARESPKTFIEKLKGIKHLRGEYFPVDNANGDLTPRARLKKEVRYIIPKKRMDKCVASLQSGSLQRIYDDPNSEAWWEVEEMGKQAGTMGASNPGPRSLGMASPGVGGDQLQQRQQPRSAPPTSPYPQGGGAAAGAQRASPGGSPPSFRPSPEMGQAEAYGYNGGGGAGAAHHGGGWGGGGGGGGGGPSPIPPSATLGAGGVSNIPHIYTPKKAPSFASPQSMASISPHKMAGHHAPSHEDHLGESVNWGGGGGAGGGGGGAPVYFDAASGIASNGVRYFNTNNRQEMDYERWERRKAAADFFGAPRPEDLGEIAAMRAPKSDAAQPTSSAW